MVRCLANNRMIGKDNFPDSSKCHSEVLAQERLGNVGTPGGGALLERGLGNPDSLVSEHARRAPTARPAPLFCHPVRWARDMRVRMSPHESTIPSIGGSHGKPREAAGTSHPPDADCVSSRSPRNGRDL